MKKKMVKTYMYNGLGFPFELHNVELVQFEGEFHPKIDVRKAAIQAAKALILQSNRLTGNQIKFIRTYFSMSLREFADHINESHTAVSKWEHFKNEPTNMDRNIEIMLRLRIYDRVFISEKNNKKDKFEFYNQFLALTKLFRTHKFNSRSCP